MSFRSLFALLGLLAVASATGAQAADKPATGDIFPYKVHETTLGNGLKVVAIPYDSPGTLAYYHVVRTGSRDEVEPGHSGFAHFFEHMMFRGTDKYPKEKYDEIMKSFGADANASTENDVTTYQALGPSSALEKLMEVESDRFKNLKYTEEVFRIEAQAVLGEYNKNNANPILPMFEKLRDLAFQKHTYKHLTIGVLEDIKAMPSYYEFSRQFFNRFYRPENVTLLVVGDIQPQRVFQLAEQYYGDWKKGYQPAQITPEPPQTERKVAHIDWPNQVQPFVMIGYHTPAYSAASPDTAGLDLIQQLLLSSSAPLYQELVVDKQWATSLQGGSGHDRDPLLFTIIAQVKSPDLVPKVKEVIDRHMTKLQTELVDDARLDRIKSHERYSFALGLTSPEAVAATVADELALTAKVETLNQYYDQVQKVTPQDIQRLAKQTFRPQNETMVTLWHGGADAAQAPAPAPTQGGAR